MPEHPPDPALIRSIENELAAAEKRVAAIYTARRQKAATAKAAEAREQSLNEALALRTALQRQLAAAQGLPYLTPCDFPVQPCTGAPMPTVLANGHKTILIFYCQEPAEAWNGAGVQIASPTTAGELAALVTFKDCHAHKLAAPNDEVWHGHPLYKRGFEGYSIQTVVNSRWIAELEAINAAHPRYDPTLRRGLNHYIFWFHDETFECIAKGFEVETTREPMTSLTARAAAKLMEHK